MPGLHEAVAIAAMGIAHLRNPWPHMLWWCVDRDGRRFSEEVALQDAVITHGNEHLLCQHATPTTRLNLNMPRAFAGGARLAAANLAASRE